MIETKTREKEKIAKTDNNLYIFLCLFAAILFGTAFLFNTPYEIWRGSLVILTSPANLITDYFQIANIGAALVNASIMVFQSILMIRLRKIPINGLLIAAVFTVAGFSLFGKNLYNSFPIIVGVSLYSRLYKLPFELSTPIALFGTALAPLVSEVSFNVGLPTHLGIICGVLSGMLAGFFMPLLSRHFSTFHKGLSLYNIGFTAGLIGTFYIAILRTFGVSVDLVNFVYKGRNMELAILLFILFTAVLIAGFFTNGRSLNRFGELLKESGRGCADFLNSYKYGLVLMNMALLGMLSTAYVLIVGGSLNGPTIGGIFTIVGFGASGKHIKNVLPVLLGVFLVGYFSIHDVSSTAALLAALFGTTLAPIAGCYGILAGIIAGGLHITLTTNISFLHAGMNLYNNGFSGGFVAAVMLPVLEKIYENKAIQKNRR